jgi:histidinol dehydrogenase
MHTLNFLRLRLCTMIRTLKNPETILEFIRSLEQRAPSEDPTVLARVQGIIGQVKTSGRGGLLNLRAELENIPTTEKLTYSHEDLRDLAERCPVQTLDVIHRAIERVRSYHQIQRDETRWTTIGKSRFASRVQPLDSVALYVPGGKAFYPSSVVMAAVPAQVAGVERLAVFTPGRSLQDPVFAATVCALKIPEIHAVGGAQAVAMAAFGIEGVARCDKIVGPGNVYVATAKQCLAGRIGIDGFAGPSEILILGDGSSNPEWIALDMLAQAEHDEDASSILVTTSVAEAEAVQQALERLLEKICLDRSSIARTSLEKWGALCVVESRDALVQVANSLNAEHLHVQTRCAQEPEGEKYWLSELKGVGAIFLGRWSAESFGDYLAGPSHVLPTAGTARFSSPLGVYDFVRRSSVLSLTQSDVLDLAESTGIFADAEQLWAHAAAARVRATRSQP